MREYTKITLLFAVLLATVFIFIIAVGGTAKEYDEHSHGESICNWAYTDGYRYGYGNQSSLHDAIKPEYQACYDEGYNDGLADYQNTLRGESN